MRTPELRKASSRRRCSSVSKSNSIIVKVFGDGQEGDLGAALAVGGADHRQRRDRHRRARNSHVVLLAVAPDGELEPVRQRVDHRDADAVQAAGDLVGVLVELPAGVQLGHDDLGRRDAFLGVDVGRDAAAVVGDACTEPSGFSVTGDRGRSGRPAPRRWRCRRPRRPCGAGPSRRRCRRYTCRAACAPRRGP